MKDLKFYNQKFSKLNVSRSHGTAPHKPTLLLSVLELISQGTIQQNRIDLSPELIATFLKYWTHLVSTDHHSNIALPFFHLTGDGFWHLAPNPGFEAVIRSRVKVRTFKALEDAVSYAYFDNELFELLQTEPARTQLINTLIQTWFGKKSQEIKALYNVDEFKAIQLKLFDQGGLVYRTEDLKDEDRTFVRSAAFRRIVVSLYEQRCAFCRLKIISSDSQNIVDGSHIKPFSQFRDDRFINGIALCKNHHWAFDRGWFGISDDYRIIIPRDRFSEEAPVASKSMHDFADELIHLPSRSEYYPSLESLQWHRHFWKLA
ncbi:HNH endonuclease [Trichothermofontia sp.]